MQAKNEGRPDCRLCLSEGIINSQVIERAIKPPSHRNQYARMICVTCWKQRRETPATCRTFAIKPKGRRADSSTSGGDHTLIKAVRAGELDEPAGLGQRVGQTMVA
jgi:hypothetical protein